VSLRKISQATTLLLLSLSLHRKTSLWTNALERSQKGPYIRLFLIEAFPQVLPRQERENRSRKEGKFTLVHSAWSFLDPPPDSEMTLGVLATLKIKEKTII